MSPGYLDMWSPRETRDIYECIEWTAAQPWCDGKVGMSGISYYAMNQYQAAALQPPHLVCILPWEGANDWYREFSHHGGILSEFGAKWYPRQVSNVQHGVGSRGPRSQVTGEPVAGIVDLPDDELERNRADFVNDIKSRPLMDPWYTDRNPDWSKVTLPMLSAGNWGGQNLHLRGNVEAFVNAASPQKWLELHGIAHWTHYYTDYGIGVQRRFLDHYLKGEDNGWDRQPRVILQVRHIPERYVERHENEWPLARTRWTKLYLDASDLSLSTTPPSGEASATYDPTDRGLTFRTAPLTEETEITGPMVGRVHISSSSEDADLFLVVRVFDPDGEEVTFQGALDPNTPISQGWLRASHRRTDPERSRPYRPYRPHIDVEPLVPGQVYGLDVEIWPSSIVVPPGYVLALSVRGNDYQYEGELSEFAKSFHYSNRGVGPYTHTDPDDRPAATFGAPVTLYTGGEHDSHLLAPVIPAEADVAAAG
jgi:predicted acyl esterase